MNEIHGTSILSQSRAIIPSVSLDGDVLSWYCPGGEEDEQCGLLNTATLADLVYHHPGQARGAMIALPKCACGAQTSLKADYTLKELYKTLQVMIDEESGTIAYVMPLRFVRNLQIHWMLHKSGKAAHAPVLEMPPQVLLEHPSFAGVKPGTVHALWFGYSVMRHYKPKELTTRSVLLLEESQS